jgi:hypothetical protein
MTTFFSKIGPKTGWTPVKLLLLVILSVMNVVQGVSLVKRVTKGATDFTVFYNTGVLLRHGAGPEIYAGKDESTEWLRTIPPFGQFVLHPLSALSIQNAAACWTFINLGLLALSAVLWFQVCDRLDGKRRLMRAVAPGFVLLLLALAPGSLQVGQFSVLFAACWLLYLRLLSSRYAAIAESALAVPAAIKLYPAFLILAPGLRRGWRSWAMFSLWMGVAVTIPAIAYGPSTVDLTESFWKNAIVSSSGRVAESQRARSASNQGIDSIGLRYLSANQPLHQHFPGLPHVDWTPQAAMRVVNLTRLAILALTFAVAGRYLLRRPRRTRWDTLLLMGLFSAALYVILPGAKSRYGIYEILAFVPLLCQAFVCRRRAHWLAAKVWNVATIGCLLAVITFLSPPLRALGVGFLGAFILWALNVALVAHWSRPRPTRKAPATLADIPVVAVSSL